MSEKKTWKQLYREFQLPPLYFISGRIVRATDLVAALEYLKSKDKDPLPSPFEEALIARTVASVAEQRATRAWLDAPDPVLLMLEDQSADE